MGCVLVVAVRHVVPYAARVLRGQHAGELSLDLKALGDGSADEKVAGSRELVRDVGRDEDGLRRAAGGPGAEIRGLEELGWRLGPDHGPALGPDVPRGSRLHEAGVQIKVLVFGRAARLIADVVAEYRPLTGRWSVVRRRRASRSLARGYRSLARRYRAGAGAGRYGVWGYGARAGGYGAGAELAVRK